MIHLQYLVWFLKLLETSLSLIYITAAMATRSTLSEADNIRPTKKDPYVVLILFKYRYYPHPQMNFMILYLVNIHVGMFISSRNSANITCTRTLPWYPTCKFTPYTSYTVKICFTHSTRDGQFWCAINIICYIWYVVICF